MFFFNDTATSEIYTLSLHDALPICAVRRRGRHRVPRCARQLARGARPGVRSAPARRRREARRHHPRSEEHTSELQSRQYLVCRLLLEKKNNDREIRKTTA